MILDMFFRHSKNVMPEPRNVEVDDACALLAEQDVLPHELGRFQEVLANIQRAQDGIQVALRSLESSMNIFGASTHSLVTDGAYIQSTVNQARVNLLGLESAAQNFRIVYGKILGMQHVIERGDMLIEGVQGIQRALKIKNEALSSAHHKFNVLTESIERLSEKMKKLSESPTHSVQKGAQKKREREVTRTENEKKEKEIERERKAQSADQLLQESVLDLPVPLRDSTSSVRDLLHRLLAESAKEIQEQVIDDPRTSFTALWSKAERNVAHEHRTQEREQRQEVVQVLESRLTSMKNSRSKLVKPLMHLAVTKLLELRSQGLCPTRLEFTDIVHNQFGATYKLRQFGEVLQTTGAFIQGIPRVSPSIVMEVFVTLLHEVQGELNRVHRQLEHHPQTSARHVKQGVAFGSRYVPEDFMNGLVHIEVLRFTRKVLNLAIMTMKCSNILAKFLPFFPRKNTHSPVEE